MTNPADGYESYMVPTLFGPWAMKLIEAADLQPGDRVLDVGCGTGIVARKVAAKLGAKGVVKGIDISADMLAVAHATAAREGADIEWREGSADRLPYPEHSFDLVLCQFALMFFPDKAAALTEVRRVVAENGRVLMSVWQGLDRHPFYQTLHHAFQRRLGVSALQGIFSLGSAAELRALVERAGFQQVEIEPISMTAHFPNPDGFLAGEIEVDAAAIPSMQHLDARARRAIVEAVTTDMKPSLEEVTHDNHVVIPFHAHIATARH